MNDFIAKKIDNLTITPGGIEPAEEGDPAWWRIQEHADSIEARSEGMGSRPGDPRVGRDPGTATRDHRVGQAAAADGGEPDTDWAGTGFSVPGPQEPADAAASRDNDAWMAGYRAGMQAAREEYAAVVAERDRSAASAELLRIERDHYADRACTAEQELRGQTHPGREPSGTEAEAG